VLYLTDLHVGVWNNWRQGLLSNDNLGRICTTTGLIGCLNVDPRNPIRNPSNGLAATLLEAVIGAVDKDGNIHDVLMSWKTSALYFLPW